MTDDAIKDLYLEKLSHCIWNINAGKEEDLLKNTKMYYAVINIPNQEPFVYNASKKQWLFDNPSKIRGSLTGHVTSHGDTTQWLIDNGYIVIKEVTMSLN